MTLSGKPVDPKYQNGIQWWSKGGGIKTQGEPYEIWVANKLQPDGYIWLADYKNNWKAFDQWNATSGDAVSDKTLDMQATTYANPNRVEARIVTNVEQMLRYQSGGGEIIDPSVAQAKGIPASLQFSKGDIDTYTLSLGVPREPTEGQWEALCKAYQFAKERVAEESLEQKRPLSINFDITDIA
ncbi:endonuclease toxin domain-containing protein [Gluconobacter oxydans]|uniref:CdiA toxin EC869-like domain-containing protein n=2 Tax=Gluconobacter oxydans TaxID=442 RepID=A0AB35AQY6_GLUOY|nr:hypothetical protein [Gluconobacter oxydans]KXV35275.1 hypothetical protein AD939_01780 [Gluconobacter oxydans]MBF0857360.1 hypothetical protein [Gluconobacter oxydans]